MKLRPPQWPRLLGSALREFFEKGFTHWGASLAFYTVFSLPPLLVIAISVSGAFLTPEYLASPLFLERIGDFLSPTGAEIVLGMLREAQGLELGSAKVVPSALLLLVAGTAVFANAQSALNDIWRLQRPGSPVHQILRSRFLSLLMILAIGGILFLSLVLTTVHKAVSDLLTEIIANDLGLIRVLDISVSGLLYWVLFATVYRVLSDANIQWRDVGLGSLITAVLFLLGKEVIASFLTRSEGASAYGAAGSIFAFLLFVYYSAQLFFFGALFTRVWAESRGRVIQA